MKYLVFFIFTVTLSANIFADKGPEILPDDAAKINYSVGYQIGKDFRQQNFEIRPEVVLKGIQDALSGSDSLLSREQMRKTMADLGQKVADLKQEKRAQAGEFQIKNKQFLINNAKKPGVITTNSGLQYRVIEAGSAGQHAKLNDKVLVHYRGRLVDGTEFDSSYKRNKPASFKVNQVIKGWTEALQIMQRGATWQLVIPADLAYGERGAGSSIPPNSTLIFDVELISIQ